MFHLFAHHVDIDVHTPQIFFRFIFEKKQVLKYILLDEAKFIFLRCFYQQAGKSLEKFANIILVLLLSFLLQIALFPTHLRAEKRVIRVGLFPAPPLVFSENNKPTGLFIELIKYFAQNKDWQIEYHPDSWDNLLKKLETGEIDLLPAISHTKERELKYDFSQHVVYVDSGVVFTSSNFRPHTVFDLKGKRIAAVQGSIFTLRFLDYLETFGIQSDLIYTNNNRQVMEAITSGEADAGVCIFSLGNKLAEEYPVKITAISFSPLALEFAVPRGKNQEILAGINQLMAKMINDPDSFYSHSFRKWTTPPAVKEIPFWVKSGIAGLLGCGVILILLILFLRRQVNLKTKDLQLEITEKEMTAGKLEEEKERLDITLRSIAEGVISTDQKGNIVLVNQVAESLTGCTFPATAGMPSFKVFTIYDVHKSKILDNPIEKVLKTGKAIDLQQVLLKAQDGNERLINYSCAPIKRKNDHIIGAILVFQDITDLKKIEQQLQHAQKMETIGNLAGGIAHDFNNILAAIIGFTELAIEDAPQGSNQKDNLREVAIASSRAKELVQQILAFAHKTNAEKTELRLDHIVKETFQLLRPTTPSIININLTLASDSYVIGNASQLSQVVMNLCTNAIHSLQKSGGDLNISLTDILLETERDDTPSNMTAGKYAELTITDNGPGIAPSIIDKIFEPYFTTKEVGEGSGMGLAMVKGIVESYGGHIQVKSEHGSDTTFTVRLPITAKTSDKKEEYYQKQSPGGKEHILLVDDEPSINRFVSRVLESLNYKVTAQKSSIEALELFKQNPQKFDLVITDMTMFAMTGDVLTAQLRQIRPDIPVILCTGYSSKINEVEAKRIGINAFVYKPISKTKLANIVREVLDAG